MLRIPLYKIGCNRIFIVIAIENYLYENTYKIPFLSTFFITSKL